MSIEKFAGIIVNTIFFLIVVCYIGGNVPKAGCIFLIITIIVIALICIIFQRKNSINYRIKSNIHLDDFISNKDWLVARTILNSKDLESLSGIELKELIDALGKIDNSDKIETIKALDTEGIRMALIKMKAILNSKNFASNSTTSLRELNQGFLTNEEMENKVDEYNNQIDGKVDDSAENDYEADEASLMALFMSKNKSKHKPNKWEKHEIANMYEMGWDEPEYMKFKNEEDRQAYKQEKWANYEYLNQEDYDEF